MDALGFGNSHLHDCKICKFKRLRSEPRIFLGENQNKQKQTFLKMLHQEHFLVMLDLEKISESLGELYKILYHRLLLTEAFIEMFRKNSCTFYGRQIVLLIIVL